MQFSYAQRFSEGMAPVKLDGWCGEWCAGQHGYIDRQGNLYQKIGRWGYVDKQGKVVIAPQFVQCEMAKEYGFHEGLAAVQVGEPCDGKFAYIAR